MDRKTVTIVRSPRDPYLRMVDNGDGLTYPCNEDGLILTAEQWRIYRDRIDSFYAACPSEEIAAYNFEALITEAEDRRQQTATSERELYEPIPGYVYLIRGVGTPWYKIGISIDTKVRLKQLGTQGPFKIELIHQLKVNDMIAVESHFHRLFNGKRAEGEWFTLTPDDIALFVGWVS